MFNHRRIIGGENAVYQTSGTLIPAAPDLSPYERGMLVELLQRCADFSGITLYTYHFGQRGYFALVRVPPVDEATDDEELIRRWEALYGEELAQAVGINLATVKEVLPGKSAEAEALRQHLFKRMGDLSMFQRIFRQRATRWYNRIHGGVGQMWGGPFTSVLVEDDPAVRSLAGAYIDLAPVREGLAAHPEHYPWCGFGAVAFGHDAMLEALAEMIDPDLPPTTALGRYRTLMQLWGPYPEPTPDALRAAGGLPLPAAPALFARRQTAMERGGAVGQPEFIAAQLVEAGFRRRVQPAPGFTSEASPVRITHLREPVPGRGRPRKRYWRVAEAEAAAASPATAAQ